MNNDIVFIGNRIVLPEPFSHRTLELGHESHQGIVKKTKTLLRLKVWWPGIDAEVERVVRQYLPWQAVEARSLPESVISTNMTSKPW